MLDATCWFSKISLLITGSEVRVLQDALKYPNMTSWVSQDHTSRHKRRIYKIAKYGELN